MPVSRETDGRVNGNLLMSVSNAMVTLHKEQFGRGPTRARAAFAGSDTVVVTLEDALLPAERALVGLGEARAVQEARLLFQAATRQIFVHTLEELVGRRVTAFATAADPDAGTIWEVFQLESADG